MLSESIRTLAVLMFTAPSTAAWGGSATHTADLSSSQVEAVHFLPQKINKYKVPKKEAAEFVFFFGSGPQIIPSGSSLTRQSSKRGHAGGLASCLPLSPTSCTGQRDEHNMLITKCRQSVLKKKKDPFIQQDFTIWQ